MSEEMTGHENKKKRGGLFFGLAYFAGVAVLVAAIYWLSPPGNDPGANEIAAPAATTTTTVANVEVEAPSFISGEEPIADAAEVILPSVVHIQTSTGIGSGVIYDSTGLIMTAAHVVEGDESVTIRLPNGEIVEGSVVGLNTEVDIAVVQVDRTGLEAAEFNQAEARVGQLAVAIGSPWNLDSTVTAGIVSAINQTNCSSETEACISMVQTDAAINPGNSGGPLVDRNGQVIGINVSIFTTSGENAGVGFAVPADTAMTYAAAIVSGEAIETAFLGISGEAAVQGQAGALIIEVFPDTAASEAGIETGDVIVSIGGVEVLGIGDLSAQIRTFQPGETVELDLIRDGEDLTMSVTFGTRPADLN
ncbi:MAG: trypsin-like peptidase domain-containing protein [Actinomycetota bacterium]|nr:trypsin-like peptidase domain-containing protein [Actinomycetota bacterium]